MEQNAKTEVSVWSLSEDSLLLLAILQLQERVQKHNQGKYANLSKYSIEGFIEWVVETGCNAATNALDADIERRDREAFTKAMAQLDPPKDPTNAADMQKYAAQITKLREKYHIGGSAKEV